MSKISYNDVLKLIPEAQPRKLSEIPCDPAVEHIIELKKYQNQVEHLIQLTANLKEVYNDSHRKAILKSLPRIPVLPETFQKIPLRNLNFTKEDIELSDDSVLSLVSKAITRILYILGYTEAYPHLLQELSKMTVEYVKSLISVMLSLVPEDGLISLDSLEVALQQKGVQGVQELYAFHQHNIVKFHDCLYVKCKHLCDSLMGNLTKPIEKSSKQTDIERDCEGDSNSSNNEEAELSSPGPSLESGELAEILYLPKKLKHKTILSSKIRNAEINSHKHQDSVELCSNEEASIADNSNQLNPISCPESLSNVDATHLQPKTSEINSMLELVSNRKCRLSNATRTDSNCLKPPSSNVKRKLGDVKNNEPNDSFSYSSKMSNRAKRRKVSENDNCSDIISSRIKRQKRMQHSSLSVHCDMDDEINTTRIENSSNENNYLSNSVNTFEHDSKANLTNGKNNSLSESSENETDHIESCTAVPPNGGQSWDRKFCPLSGSIRYWKGLNVVFF